MLRKGVTMLFVKKNTLSLLFVFAILFSLFFTQTPVLAAEKAYLYFYTVDGEEIEKLTKRINVTKEYTFANPDDYKYLAYEDGNGNLVYNENNSLITGIHWEEERENGQIVQYKEGDIVTFTAGDHYIFVKSDNPTLTGENLLNLSKSEQAHLYFFNANGEEISSLYKDLSPKDDFVFPDPEQYDYRTENGADRDGDDDSSDNSTYTGKGIYWWCEDENEKQYLFANNDKCKFKAGEYNLYVKTDDPVTVTFYYPIDFETYYVVEKAPGEIHSSLTAKIGDTITLKKSLGAIIWEHSFMGWEEVNVNYPDKTLSGGSSYRIMSNSDLDFFAIYEYDENWNPNAIDENKTADELNQENEDEVIVDITQINEAAGAGYGAYIDSTGTLRHTGGNNGSGTIKFKTDASGTLWQTGGAGIPGKIKVQNWLSSIIDPTGDINDPGNYHYDKYGRRMEDSTLESEINNVLRQDDSAMYMDVYGNSFIYYSGLTRASNMNLALERLSLGKTDSWVKNVQNWDSEIIKRFEAVEFALLSGTYPSDGEELVSGVTWKSSYMSQAAFSRLLNYKKLWNGWFDEYDDGLLEKYTPQSGNKSTTVGWNKIRELFEINAYAAEDEGEKNNVGIANQIGSRINNSTDLKNIRFKPQYYKQSQLYNFSAYSFTNLNSELSADQLSTLQQIFNALVEYGFTEEAAAGACGNIWQECGFNYKVNGGFVQWMGSRVTRLEAFASEKGVDYHESLSVQIEFMKKELNERYLSDINTTLKKIAGASATMSSVKDVKAACDAWCVAMEGCTCYNSIGELYAGHNGVHNSLCGTTLNTSYQHLEQRRIYAQKIYDAMVVGSSYIGGSFAGMSNEEIKNALFPGLPSYSVLGAYYSEAEMSSRVISIPVGSSGKTIRVHKAIAEGAQTAIAEITANGFVIKEISGFGYRGIARNGSYLSVKTNASFHASGLAIDINWTYSPQFAGTPGISIIQQQYKPLVQPLAVNSMVYNAFKKQGLLWGRDFSSWYDLMHFSLGEVSNDGRNAWITNQTEGLR